MATEWLPEKRRKFWLANPREAHTAPTRSAATVTIAALAITEVGQSYGNACRVLVF
jgi:hypothetical protein